MAEKAADLNLPSSVITNIIKEALPENVLVSKETRVAISKAATVFILYCTACANNFAAESKRKTLKESDVHAALREMGLESFIPIIQASLKEFQKVRDVKNERKRKARELNNSLANGDESKNQKLENENVELNNLVITTPAEHFVVLLIGFER